MNKLSVNFWAILIAICVVPFFSACKEDPEDPPKSDEKTLTNLKVIAGGQELVVSALQSDGKTFEFYVPMGFNEADLQSGVVTFTIPATATAEPASASEVNLTVDVPIKVTAENETSETYTLKRVNLTSAEKAFLSFVLFEDTDDEMVGNINATNFQITFAYPSKLYSYSFWNALAEQAPTFTISPGATIDFEPGDTKNFQEEVSFEITANDGTKQIWKVLAPPMPSYGIKPGSGKILFEKKMNDDLGITILNLTNGIAAIGDKIVLQTRTQNSLLLDSKTGEIVGGITLSEDMKNTVRGFYCTADNAGNILMNNLSNNDGTFKAWRLGLDGEETLLIDWDNSEITPPNIGRKLSIKGDLDANAIITAPLLTAGGQALVQTFARWTIENGTLKSNTPEIIDITGLASGWNANADIVQTSSTDANSDYFLAAYQENALAWINGATNELRSKVLITTGGDAGNYIANAVDYVEFNGGKYATLNWVNSFDWGSSDLVWLLDVTTADNFVGSLVERTCPAVLWECERGKYGSRHFDPPVPNGNQTADVAFLVSDNKLYLYFMFSNGWIVGVEFEGVE